MADDGENEFEGLIGGFSEIPWAQSNVRESVELHRQLGQLEGFDERTSRIWDAAALLIFCPKIWWSWLKQWEEFEVAWETTNSPDPLVPDVLLVASQS